MPSVDELFELRYGHSLELNRLALAEAPEGVNFVSRTTKNNGVTARVHTSATPGAAGEMTVALSGNGVLSTFVQPEAFVTGYHVMILKPRKPAMSTVEKLWWAACIGENRYRYSFGRQANRSLPSLKLPDQLPDWVESTLVPDVDHIAAALTPTVPFKSVNTWNSYRLDALFDIRRGKYIPKILQRPGTTRVVTSSAFNNGTTKWLDIEPIFPAGSITVARNGSIGVAHYQAEPYFASDDVHVFIPRAPLDPYAALFICTIIRQEQFRYMYGRKWSLERMKETVVALPHRSTGEPDWAWMAQYIKGLSYSAAVES